MSSYGVRGCRVTRNTDGGADVISHAVDVLETRTDGDVNQVQPGVIQPSRISPAQVHRTDDDCYGSFKRLEDLRMPLVFSVACYA